MARVLRLVTANVNGIRAAARRGGLDWLARSAAQVMCLQEVRATDEQLAEVLDAAGLGHLHVAHTEAASKGRAGVAVLTTMPHRAVRTGVGPGEFAESGRWLEVDVDTEIGPLTVVSTYVHTGEASDEARQSEKLRFLDAMEERLVQLGRPRVRRQAVLCGDLNVAHTEHDIKNWRGNRGKAGFLEDERAYLTRWFDEHGYVDLGRRFGGEGPGPYTWWSWRGRGFDTDGGWRIDYAIASTALASRVTDVVVHKAATYAERWSDHAALTVDFAR
ncbi:MAG TPA: exodeoxyribonuclease III [Candidatus Nanopelagicales bacterium]|nr:exodeoxyribonuclease III [Candidatus Nanopelagicales bacterium]